MSDWEQVVSFFDFCARYYTTQLVRCAVFSFVLIGIVMLFRRTIFSQLTFFRGMLWAFFIMIPFLGRLKLFYEDTPVRKVTWWLTQGIQTCLWADRIYMAGILAAAVWIFGKRFRLHRKVAAMECTSIDNIHIRITNMNVTPFTVGLLRPKIVLPEVMADSLSREEWGMVVQHEQTHIRLGHLWCGFAWDILRCLLWINPFLSICQKYFREDMEDICDRVCIQNSGQTAYQYGMVLLKSMKIMGPGHENAPSAITYVGEEGFQGMKRRMEKIAGFCPYRKKWCMGMAAGVFLVIMAVLSAVWCHSYGRYNESRDIMIGKYDGEPSIISCDTETLSRMISYDNDYVYVDREVFEGFLRQHHAEGDIYIIFGGYYKFPGLGGAAEACIYERGQESIVKIPYESIKNSWVNLLYMIL